VEEIHNAVFRNKFPDSPIKVGDEVIKINNLYCEHLGNVERYVERTNIRSLQMISKATGEVYVDVDESVETVNMDDAQISDRILNSTAPPPRPKRKKYTNTNLGPYDLSLTQIESTNNDRSSLDLFRDSGIQFLTRRYGCLALNGLYVSKQSFRYFVEEINETVFRNKFRDSPIQIGDEVIKVNNLYCEHLGNVGKYLETTNISSLQMISKVTGEVYVDEDASVHTINMDDAHTSCTTLNSSSIHPRQKRTRHTVEMNHDSNTRLLDLTITENENNEINIETAGIIEQLSPVSNANEETTNQRNRSRKNELDMYWEYDKPCRHCDYVHLKGASSGQKKKCCLQGKALREPCPQLKQLPPMMLHYAKNRLQHMGRNSVSYNSVLSCAATGVENNDGGGFEHIHGEHAVRLHGRTYHFLTTSTGNAGLNFFTFDNLANCTEYATSTLNNEERGYQRIIPSFLANIFRELKEFNSICQECEQIGSYAMEYMGSSTTMDAFAIINESTSYLDVAQITSDVVTGNRIITFQRKGERRASSLNCTAKMWAPFIYPLLFSHAERGWGADLRGTLKYTDYLAARLLCPEKIVCNGDTKTLRVPNQSLDKFIRPIIKQQLGDIGSSSDEDEAYQYYSEIFGAILQSSRIYEECVRSLLKCFCTELKNITTINGFDEFCNLMYDKLHFEKLDSLSMFIKTYIQSRRDNGLPKEEIENSLEEISLYHMENKLKKGRMVLIPTNRFQLMSRLSQTYLVDSISRAIDYRLRFHKFHQKDLFGIDNEGETNDENGESGEKTFLSQSMHGSRRHLRSLAKNALALVSEYGRPSLFITLTCNPYWPEIVEQLLPGQTAFDRGDIVCQVFFRKLSLWKILQSYEFNGKLP